MYAFDAHSHQVLDLGAGSERRKRVGGHTERRTEVNRPLNAGSDYLYPATWGLPAKVPHAYECFA